MHLHKLNIKFSSILRIQPYCMEPVPFPTPYNSLQLNWLSQLHLSASQRTSCQQEPALMTQLPTQITQELFLQQEPAYPSAPGLPRQASERPLSEQLARFISPVSTTIFA